MKQKIKDILNVIFFLVGFLWFCTVLLLPIYYLLWQYVFTDHYGRVYLVAMAIIIPLIVPFIANKKS